MNRLVTGGLVTATLLGCGSMVHAEEPLPVLPIEALVKAYQASIIYPSATSSLTIPNPASSASITLNLARQPNGLKLILSAASLKPNECALVSVGVPPLEPTEVQAQDPNRVARALITNPFSLQPLGNKTGYCGSKATFQQVRLDAPTTEISALLRLPDGLKSDTKIPFTMRVFFLEVDDQPASTPNAQ